jgi:hypothetical protein
MLLCCQTITGWNLDQATGAHPNRLLKNGASGRDPALRGSCKCSHIGRYAALSKSPRALADDPMLVFQQPVKPARSALSAS